MKFFLLIGIMFLFVLFAIYIYYKYLVRYKLYKDCEYVCKQLKNNISFNKNDINKLLETACLNISSISRKIITEHNFSSIFIKHEDTDVVSQFLTSLGKGDVAYEINNINYYENIFSDLKESSHSQLKTNGTMYLKLIIGIGIAVIIILI